MSYDAKDLFAQLSENQRSVIPHVLECVTIEKTAARTGLPESMLRDWFRQPSFRREMDNYRRDLARSIMFKLEKGACKAIDRLLELMDDDIKQIALKASDSLLVHLMTYKQMYGLHETIDELESSINKANKAKEIAG